MNLSKIFQMRMIFEKLCYTFHFRRAEFLDVVEFNDLSVATCDVRKFVAVVRRQSVIVQKVDGN